MKRSAFRMISREGLAWVESVRLARFPWLVHAFSTRRRGTSPDACQELDLGHSSGERAANIDANRQRFLQALGAERLRLAELQQVHSADAYQVSRDASGELRYAPAGFTIGDSRSLIVGHESKIVDWQSPNPPPGDALITNSAGILLSIRTADCMPILVADRRRRAIATIHAGWRGALARIVEKTVAEMRRAFDSRPADLLAVIGPSIRACCYEVGEEIVDAFRGAFRPSDSFFTTPRENAIDPAALRHSLLAPTLGLPPLARESTVRSRLDLVAVARYQLLAAGVAPSRIQVDDFCTACRTDLFFSYRMEGSRAGRMLAVIGIRN